MQACFFTDFPAIQDNGISLNLKFRKQILEFRRKILEFRRKILEFKKKIFEFRKNTLI